MKFFRSIRQRLLNNDRVGKYALYALGEIVLVVIGILIALSINNWNVESGERKTAEQYKIRLANELKTDLENFSKARDRYTRRNEAVISLLEIFNEENPIVSDTAQFWKNFLRISGGGPWHREPVIWTQLVQSGELKLIDDQELVEALFAHYAKVKNVVDNYNEYPTETLNETRRLVVSSLADSKAALPNSSELNSQPPKEMLGAVLDNKEEYRKMLYRVSLIARSHIFSLENLMKSAEKTIALIEKEN